MITIGETAQGCAGILKILDSGVLLASMWERVVLAPLEDEMCFCGRLLSNGLNSYRKIVVLK